MKRCPKIVILASLTTFAAVTFGLSATARPRPDRVGVCYAFKGNAREQVEPCVISAGYAVGAHYITLRWLDGTNTRIVQNNYCPERNYDEHGFCGYIVDDQAAELYQRDVFLAVTTTDDAENMTCFRVASTRDSFCYRLNE